MRWCAREHVRPASSDGVWLAGWAVAAAQMEAWEDAISHVSASAGVASHVCDESYRLTPAEAWGAPDVKGPKSFAAHGLRGVSGFSGLLDSQVGETSADDEELPDGSGQAAKSASSMVPSKGVAVGETLNGRYGLVRLLGAGAFGQVFLAEDKVEGGHVAIKVQGAGNRQSQVARTPSTLNPNPKPPVTGGSGAVFRLIRKPAVKVTESDHY